MDRVFEVDMECQTDAFLDRPATPLFIPAKTGRDVATQILEGEVCWFQDAQRQDSVGPVPWPGPNGHFLAMYSQHVG